MIHHVARSAASLHSPFLHIFQQAAARAYTRVQSSSSPARLFNSGPSTSRKSFDSTRNFKLTSLQRLPSNLPGRCRFLRRYSSRSRARKKPKGVPLLPVPSGLPSPVSCYREKVKKQLPRSRKSQRNQEPRYVLMRKPTTSDTKNLANTWIDSVDHAPTSSTALEDDPLSNLSEIYDTSRSAVTKSSIRHAQCPLSQSLLHLYMSSHHAPIQSLVSYHNTFPDQQSSQSYNLLLRLAIRHSAFGTAHALLQSMRASRVAEDKTTWKLCVRLLVREGRWPEAYNLIFNLPKTLSRAPFISDGVPITVWVELLGTLKRRAFRGGLARHPGMSALPRYSHVMHQLPKLGVSSMDTPPPKVVYASVAALIRMQEREAARRVTNQFLSMDPKGLGLQLLHLHVAAEPRSRSLCRAIRDLKGFCALCPELKPNSTTLFLLLGHLKRLKRCGTFGHRLVRVFRRRWGESVVSPGVERRLLALAVKEKRVDLIKRWMTCVKLRKVGRMWNLEREVVDGAVPRRRSVTRYPELRLAGAGTERFRVNRLVRRASRVLRGI